MAANPGAALLPGAVVFVRDSKDVWRHGKVKKIAGNKCLVHDIASQVVQIAGLKQRLCMDHIPLHPEKFYIYSLRHKQISCAHFGWWVEAAQWAPLS